jgi:hypothetical protein
MSASRTTQRVGPPTSLVKEACMSNLARSLGRLAVAALLCHAPIARGELAAWDQAQATTLAKALRTETESLYDTFLEQPQPDVASMQSNSYHRLKQMVRLLRIEARQLAESLEKGEGREQTLPTYENLMQLTRSARDEAARVFVARDVGERAAAVRGVLNRLGPFYDPDFPALAPHPNIEPGTAR